MEIAMSILGLLQAPIPLLISAYIPPQYDNLITINGGGAVVHLLPFP
jgi:hypothetical protein